jgi:hypothetical protein
LGDALKGNPTLTSLSLNLRSEYSLGLVGDLRFRIPFVEVCVTLHWLDCSRSIVEYHALYYYHVSSAVVAIVAFAFPTASPIGTGFC